LVADFLRILDIFVRLNSTEKGTPDWWRSTATFLRELEHEVKILDAEFKLLDREGRLKFSLSAFSQGAEAALWLPVDFVEIRDCYFQPRSWIYELHSPRSSDSDNTGPRRMFGRPLPAPDARDQER
jgi:hypothetical protein